MNEKEAQFIPFDDAINDHSNFSQFKKASEQAKSELLKSNDELLNEIFYWSNPRKIITDAPPQINVLLTYFSALLVKISQTAENQTKKIITLTRWLIIWTILLFAITVMIVLKDFGVIPNIPNQIIQTMEDHNNTNDHPQNQKTLNDENKKDTRLNNRSVQSKNK